MAIVTTAAIRHAGHGHERTADAGMETKKNKHKDDLKGPTQPPSQECVACHTCRIVRLPLCQKSTRPSWVAWADQSVFPKRSQQVLRLFGRVGFLRQRKV